MRPEKQLLLDEIKDQIDSATMMVMLSYSKMDPNLAAKLRLSLHEIGGNLEVVRKRILLKAVEAAGFSVDLDTLTGHVGVVFTDKDPVQVTKTIYQFAKENEEVLQVLAGRFEGKLVSATDVKQIADLPSKDEMRAQLLGTFEAPLAQTLAVMEALLASVPHCLENFSTKNSEV